MMTWGSEWYKNIFWIQVESFKFDLNQGLLVPQGVEKGAILYDLLKDMVVKQYRDNVYSLNTDPRLMYQSRDASIGIDQELQVTQHIVDSLWHSL